MTYFIVHEDDYKNSGFENAEEIKSDSIRNAIVEFIKVFSKMDPADDEVDFYISENERPYPGGLNTSIMKYTINCCIDYNIQFIEYV